MHSAYVQLLNIYNAMGYSVRIGLNPAHFRPGFGHLQFCYIFKDGKQLSTGAGISLQEVFFFECLFRVCRPRNIFIVGNAFGWSTILMSICNPSAKVVALDSGVEGEDAMAGINLTNEIIRRFKLKCSVVHGSSPGDVPKAAAALNAPIEFAFIDGLHTNQQQAADFKAISALAHPRCIYTFHDVIEWNMQDSFYTQCRLPHYVARTLIRTPSGMGMLYPAHKAKVIDEVARAFSHDPACTMPDNSTMPGKFLFSSPRKTGA